MRLVILRIGLIALTVVFSCKSHINKLTNSDQLNKAASICPKGGHCSFKSALNTSVVFKIDEFNIGYVDYLEKKATLLTFEYIRDEIPNTVDDQYIERLYIELPPVPQALLLKDNALQQVHLLFERLCYCKGETGIYQINQGTLSLQPLGEDRFHLKLTFKTSDVPHIITEIDEIFSLKQS